MTGRIVAIAKLAVLELFRKRDVYVALVLALAVAVPLAAVNAFGVAGAVRYVREVMLLLVWAFSVVICVTTSARQLPGEIQRRTILPLLSKPVTRAEFVVGKTCGAIAASWGALLVFYLAYVLIAGMKSGYWVDTVLVQGFLLHGVFAMVVCSMVMLGSMLLTPSANLACSILLVAGGLLFGDQIPGMVAKSAGPGRHVLVVLENLLPRFELFDLRLRVIHGWGQMSWTAFALVVLYGTAYAAVFMAAATFLFKRKHF